MVSRDLKEVSRASYLFIEPEHIPSPVIEYNNLEEPLEKEREKYLLGNHCKRQRNRDHFQLTNQNIPCSTLSSFLGQTQIPEQL